MLKAIYLADGAGLPQELVEKASSQVKSVLRLFYAETESLIEQFKYHRRDELKPPNRFHGGVPEHHLIGADANGYDITCYFVLTLICSI